MSSTTAAPTTIMDREENEHCASEEALAAVEGKGTLTAPRDLRPLPLPAELRNMIYDLCYGEEREIKVRFRRDWRSSEKLREQNEAKDFVVCSTSIQGNIMLMPILTAYFLPHYLLGSSARQQAVFRRSRPSLGAEQSFHPQLSIR